MPPSAKVPNFGSQDYWDQRFTSNTTPFDWLSAPDALDPLIADAIRNSNEENPQILHIGCGSSMLSRHLKTHVKTPRQIHNIDYSSVVIEAEKKRELDSLGGSVDECARWNAVDLLDIASLVGACGQSVYHVVVDKSTSDAISCADDVVCHLPYAVSTKQRTAADRMVNVEPKELPIHPLHLMAVHLALFTKPSARWISLSYTAERFPFLDGEAVGADEDGTADTGIPDPRSLWTVVGRHRIEAEEQDSEGGVTHRPRVYHWVYVLQRTSTPLSLNDNEV